MKIYLVFSMLLSHAAHSSALVQIMESTKTIEVTARMVYSGPAATKNLAKVTTDEIQSMWNETPTKVKLGASAYTVRFNIDYVLAGLAPMKNKESCAYNFIKILNKQTAEDRSLYQDLGSNQGVFYTSDKLGQSTTAAHEFGHGLMLKHTIFNRSFVPGLQLFEERSVNVPGIMFPRGAIVDADFQRDPRALPGEEGGTLDPIFRKVRSQDIQAIPFASVRFNSENMGCIGVGKVKRIN